MLLGTRPLNIAPLATTYNGIRYDVNSVLESTWVIDEYVTKVLTSTWSIGFYVEVSLDTSWDIAGYIKAELNTRWDIQAYTLTSLNTYWAISYQNEIPTGNAYCLAPVERVSVVNCLITKCDCEE